MTVKELIEKLKEFDENLEVWISGDIEKAVTVEQFIVDDMSWVSIGRD